MNIWRDPRWSLFFSHRRQRASFSFLEETCRSLINSRSYQLRRSNQTSAMHANTVTSRLRSCGKYGRHEHGAVHLRDTPDEGATSGVSNGTSSPQAPQHAIWVEWIVGNDHPPPVIMISGKDTATGGQSLFQLCAGINGRGTEKLAQFGLRNKLRTNEKHA